MRQRRDQLARVERRRWPAASASTVRRVRCARPLRHSASGSRFPRHADSMRARAPRRTRREHLRRSAAGVACCSGCNDSCRTASARRASACRRRARTDTRAARTERAQRRVVRDRAERQQPRRLRAAARGRRRGSRCTCAFQPASACSAGGRHLTELVIRQSMSVSGSSRSETARRREPRGVQRLVEQDAGEIAGERPAGRVRAVHAGREPDDHQARVRVAERRHRQVAVVGMLGAHRGEEAREPRAARAAARRTRPSAKRRCRAAGARQPSASEPEPEPSDFSRECASGRRSASRSPSPARSSGAGRPATGRRARGPLP